MNRVLLTGILDIVTVTVVAGHCYACGPPPTAVISGSDPKYTYKDTEIQIDGSTSHSGYNIRKYEWDWTDDDSYDCEETPSSNTCDDDSDGKASHPYDTAGVYTVRLKVTDTLYRTDTETCKVYVDTPRVYNTNQEKGYSHIQLAIDEASTNDELVVQEGICYETIDFGGKNLILRSTNPDDPDVVANTIIDGVGLASVVTFEGSEPSSCKLTGFTIRDGGFKDYEIDFPNLKAHWKLDETSGDALDSSGNNYDGTLLGDTPLPVWEPSGGQIDGALSFDGEDDYVNLSNHSTLKPLLPITISAWINIDIDTSTRMTVISLDNVSLSPWSGQRHLQVKVELCSTGTG